MIDVLEDVAVASAFFFACAASMTAYAYMFGDNQQMSLDVCHISYTYMRYNAHHKPAIGTFA